MQWFIALNQAIDPEYVDLTRDYESFAKIAVYSARKNAPGLVPNLIYNGPENQFTADMQKMGVRVIHHKLSFEHLLDDVPGRGQGWRHVARGAMLRMDIPDIVDGDDTILYTDTDVIFLSDPSRYAFPCDVFAAGPEFAIDNYKDINTGAMVINLAGARQSFRELNAWTVQNLAVIPDFDQGAFRYFYNGNWARLDPRMNWKPYWGISPDPIIVHYHGPKPNFFKPGSMERNFSSGALQTLYDRNPEGYAHFVRIWYGYYIEYQQEFNDAFRRL